MAETRLEAEQRIPDRQHAEVSAAAAGAHQRTCPAAVVDTVSLLPAVKPQATSLDEARLEFGLHSCPPTSAEHSQATAGG
jgi:hypothetical protein